MTLIVPVLIVFLFTYAFFRHIDPFEVFVEGASDAIPMLKKLLPNMAAILAGITLFGGSGALAALTHLLATPAKAIGIPSETVHLLLMRPLSGSGSLAILSDILNRYGADSYIGLCASVSVGSTETILYTIPLYCGTFGIKRTRYAFAAAIISGIVGVISGIFFIRLFLF